MSRTFTTTQGTELPLLNLRGKDYLEVKYRLVWFREEHPQWSIETELISISDRHACARAVIRDETGRALATSHKAESITNFHDFMEKAETGAIGRALALIGYGTQFCADELDEGDRIVDSPVANASSNSSTNAGLTFAKPDLGEFMITFGKKYMGKRLKEIPQDEIEGYLKWLEGAAAKKNQALTPEVALLKSAVERYYSADQTNDQAEPIDAKEQNDSDQFAANA